ncbi:MAG TPA: N-acetylmuramoyl-L-alanine amidase [Candidatus Saccharimonadales bacterium]|nr:N-acetylmuramoyl-L-alanine amidase [Candidatus Saccharimonadales bacterium]
MIRLKTWAILTSRVLLVSAAIALLVSAAPIAAAAPFTSSREQSFRAAATEFGVPADILKAISYNQSRWENHAGQPSASGGYGLMHLTTKLPPTDGRGDSSRPLPQRAPGTHTYTLDQAAKILGVSPQELKENDTQNIRGGAAMLAHYAKEGNNGKLPTKLSDWYMATARLSSASTEDGARAFADNVYQTLQDGTQRTTLDGQTVAIAPQPVSPDQSKAHQFNLPKRPAPQNSETECPRTITCKWVPARFAQNDPNNPYDYGNYDLSNRERDLDIKYIVIHDTEGSYQSAIDWYQDPRSYVSVQYTIRSSDGEVTQSVKNDDIAWQAGNWYVNTHSIGIEHEGFAAEGAAWYTEAMYRSSAKLVRYLAEKYDIPLDREHIIGHAQFHALRPDRAAGMHWDPGPYWDWDHYMDLLHQPTLPTAAPDSKVVTIAPKFPYNKPTVTQCEATVCMPLPEQSANFVYLRTEPSNSAPLLTDAALHPGGEPGTIKIEDWSAKATHGQRFVVAERRNNWTAIWFNGQKGWFYNWDSAGNRVALPAKANRLIKPKTGLASIPIYGRPLPDASEYPEGAPVEPIVPLQYSITAGQTYIAYDKKASNDHLIIWTFDFSSPGDGVIVHGDEKYIPIAYSHRQAYVKARDVEFIRN